jgi:periplasmic divalent cation tolerance protein
MTSADALPAIVVVYATCASVDEAKMIGASLVEARLAACVNILPGMTSLYQWQGRVEEGYETVLVIKTRASLSQAVIAHVKARHSYTNPALLVLPVISGSPDFLRWIAEETRVPGA